MKKHDFLEWEMRLHIRLHGHEQFKLNEEEGTIDIIETTNYVKPDEIMECWLEDPYDGTDYTASEMGDQYQVKYRLTTDPYTTRAVDVTMEVKECDWLLHTITRTVMTDEEKKVKEMTEYMENDPLGKALLDRINQVKNKKATEEMTEERTEK